MRKSVIILLILILLILGDCSGKKDTVPSNLGPAASKTEVSTSKAAAQSSDNMNYNIAKANYTNKNIKISLPQINNLSDGSKQKKLNELIKTGALKVINNYKDEVDNLTLDIDYEIKWKSPNILSIAYSGYANVKNAVHPSNMFYTTNININKEALIQLKDIVNIDSNLAEKYKNGKYKRWEAQPNEKLKAAITKAVGDFTSNDLVEQFKQEGANFYFTKDSLGISVEVPHALGDHGEFEVAYADLSNNIKGANESWKDFPKNSSESKPSETKKQPETSREMLSFKTYANERYGYSISYPSVFVNGKYLVSYKNL